MGLVKDGFGTGSEVGTPHRTYLPVLFPGPLVYPPIPGVLGGGERHGLPWNSEDDRRSRLRRP